MNVDDMIDRYAWRITAAAMLLLGLALVVLLSGCQTYNERFTYIGPDGATNHVVHVSYKSCLMWGEAAALKTETQTGEFIRTVNADGLMSRPDPEAVKAISEGVSAAVIQAITKGTGVP